MPRILAIPIHSGSDPEPVEIDDAGAVYGGREEIETASEFDDDGNTYERCPGADNGHLFKTECGVTRCVHCGKISWA